MTTFSKIVISSVLAVSSIFGGSALASTHVACGSSSFTIGHDNQRTYVTFNDGGRAVFSDRGRKAVGSWWWSGNDAVTNINGLVTVWDDAGTQSCDYHY